MPDDKKKHEDEKPKKHAHGEGPVSDPKAEAAKKPKKGRKEKAPATIQAG